MARIKFQIPRGLVKRKETKKPYHWWLVEEPPRKAGRLAQLSRRNSRMRLIVHQRRRAEGSAEIVRES